MEKATTAVKKIDEQKDWTRLPGNERRLSRLQHYLVPTVAAVVNAVLAEQGDLR